VTITARLNHSKLGASEVDVILGLNQYRSVHDVWSRIVLGFRPDESDELREMADLGKATEEATARYHVRKTYAPLIELGPLVSEADGIPDDPDEALLVRTLSREPEAREWQRYTLDFYVRSSRLELPIVLECKNRNRWSFEAQGWGEPGTGEVAISVMAQVQAQMEAFRSDRDQWVGTNIPEVDSIDVPVLLDGQRLRSYRVQRDAEAGAGIVEACERFWRDHILTKIPPPVDGSNACAQWLERRYPSPDERLGRRLRPALATEEPLVRALYSIVEDSEKLEVIRREIENRLKASIREDVGIKGLLDGEHYSIRWSVSAGHIAHAKVIEELARRYDIKKPELDALREGFRGPSLRRFTPKFHRKRPA